MPTLTTEELDCTPVEELLRDELDSKLELREELDGTNELLREELDNTELERDELETALLDETAHGE